MTIESLTDDFSAQRVSWHQIPEQDRNAVQRELIRRYLSTYVPPHKPAKTPQGPKAKAQCRECEVVTAWNVKGRTAKRIVMPIFTGLKDDAIRFAAQAKRDYKNAELIWVQEVGKSARSSLCYLKT